MKLTVKQQLIKEMLVIVMDAVKENTLADCQDGGKNVDVVFSHKKGKEKEVMGLLESEDRLDAALKQAWIGLTGKDIEGDPVAFFNN